MSALSQFGVSYREGVILVLSNKLWKAVVGKREPTYVYLRVCIEGAARNFGIHAVCDSQTREHRKAIGFRFHGLDIDQNIRIGKLALEKIKEKYKCRGHLLVIRGGEVYDE